MNDFKELTIGHTWDGHPLPRPRHGYLRLLRGPWDPEVWFGTAPLDGSGGDIELETSLELYEPGLYLRVEAPFHNDPAPQGPPGPTQRLWEHEVVELFIAGGADGGGADTGDESATPYLELEMSPWGHYLCLRLRGIRQVVESSLRLPYRARRSGEIWWGEAFVPVRWLPPTPHRVNAFAIHGQGPQRRYLAASPVPGPTPDFHRLSLFPEIELPGVT